MILVYAGVAIFGFLITTLLLMRRVDKLTKEIDELNKRHEETTVSLKNDYDLKVYDLEESYELKLKKLEEDNNDKIEDLVARHKIELENLEKEQEKDFSKFTDDVEQKTKELSANYQKVIDDYAKFFEDTLDNVDQSVKYMRELMRREVLSNDPDIQMVNKIINYFYYTLINYLQNGSEIDKNVELEIVKGKNVVREILEKEEALENTENTSKTEERSKQEE
jgi:hypothetical protein